MNFVPVTKLFRGLKDPRSIEEALEQMGADFSAEKRDVYFIGDDGDPVKVEHQCAVVNTENMQGLSIMRARYGLVQYRDALSFLSEAVANGTAEFYGGRATDGGARIHIVMRATEFMEIGPGERVECYFTVSTSHDGTGQIQAMCTPIHSVTQTVFTPLKDGVFKIKHTVKANQRLAQVGRVANKMHEFFANYQESFRSFIDCNINHQQARDYFFMLCPDSDGPNKTRAENIRNKMFDIYVSNPIIRGLPTCRDSLWGAFQTAMVYADQYKTVRASNIRSEVDAKLESRLNGAGAQFKAEAFAASLEIMRMFE
jgi:phage/plasmid-like protein (TIGR03299 family)